MCVTCSEREGEAALHAQIMDGIRAKRRLVAVKRGEISGNEEGRKKNVSVSLPSCTCSRLERKESTLDANKYNAHILPAQ